MIKRLFSTTFIGEIVLPINFIVIPVDSQARERWERTSMAYMNPRLILLLLLALVATTGVSQVCAQQSGTRLALVIGNADYPDAEAPLKELLNNTRAFADELKRQGFEVDVGENLTKEAMRAAIERFHGKIKSGSTALIFFSGYGLQSSRQTYIVPVNAQIWTEADARRDGFNLDSILAEMHSKGARVKIAILDASRRNPFERRFRTVPAGLAPVVAPNNTAVMYAAAPSMVVRDSDRSLFVTELLKEIRIAGQDRGGFQPHSLQRVAGVPGRAGPVVFLFAGRGIFVRARAAETDRHFPGAQAGCRRGCAARVSIRRAHRNEEGLGGFPRQVSFRALFRSRTRPACEAGF